MSTHGFHALSAAKRANLRRRLREQYGNGADRANTAVGRLLAADDQYSWYVLLAGLLAVAVGFAWGMAR